jgi:hypothetical protein
VASAAVLLDAQRLLASRPPAPDESHPYFDESEYDDRFSAYLARYEALEERFAALVDDELYPRAAAYVRGHPQEFAK